MRARRQRPGLRAPRFAAFKRREKLPISLFSALIWPLMADVCCATLSGSSDAPPVITLMLQRFRFLMLASLARNSEKLWMPPTTPAGVPWDSSFKLESFNYSPLVLVIGLIVGIWWWIDAKNKYTGPVRTIDTDELGHVLAEEPSAAPPPAAPPPAAPPPPAPAS